MGHKKAAQQDLAKAVSLESRDRLAGELLVVMGGELPKQRPIAAPKPPEDTAATVTRRAGDKEGP